MAAPTKPLLGSGGGGGTDERVKISISDTTAGYLSTKLVVHVDTPISLNILNPGANETLEIDLDGDQIDIDWVPTNYTRNASPAEAGDIQDLTAHLKGIDDEFGLLGSGKQFLQFSADVAVPNSGTAYLKYGEVFTSSAPVTVLEAVDMHGATVKVDIADATNNYDIEFLVNGVVRETLNLTSTNDEATDATFTYSLAAGDNIEVRMVRTAGSGRSDFDDITVLLVTQAV